MNNNLKNDMLTQEYLRKNIKNETQYEIKINLLDIDIKYNGFSINNILDNAFNHHNFISSIQLNFVSKENEETLNNQILNNTNYSVKLGTYSLIFYGNHLVQNQNLLLSSNENNFIV